MGKASEEGQGPPRAVEPMMMMMMNTALIAQMKEDFIMTSFLMEH
jgi:hypothetical protein